MQHFLQQAAQELDVETKVLLPDVEAYLKQLDWPGNVRQLENLCRWLTVMAPGKEIRLDDLPVEMHQAQNAGSPQDEGWQAALKTWADKQLVNGEERLLKEALPAFERIMIEVALARTGGRRQDAARLLGWGRNTLTRKIKELEMGAGV
jgi:two-component system nitrogen regulation response regulator GlnG